LSAGGELLACSHNRPQISTFSVGELSSNWRAAFSNNTYPIAISMAGAISGRRKRELRPSSQSGDDISLTLFVPATGCIN